MSRFNPSFLRFSLALFLSLVWFSPLVLFAHCDTFDGPVLIEAQKALEVGRVTPLLKWVKPDREEAIKRAFDEALKQRKIDRNKADHHFFTTFIRIHREGEGAPFTGIKPAGTPLPPAILAADQALETGSSKALIELLVRDLMQKVEKKYRHALEKRKTMDKSIADGREYVEAYVDYVHTVEALSELLAEESGHHHESAGGAGVPKTGPTCSGHDK